METQTPTLKLTLVTINTSPARTSDEINQEVARTLEAAGYTVELADYSRPWGGFTQLTNSDADRFVAEFFPGLSPEEARLGNEKSELSPKLLVVAPGQRLSWQYHERRAERWAYITDGGYVKSVDDTQRALHPASAGDVVQFEKSERHRLVGAITHYTLVAEIWQHTTPEKLSDEADIIRLEDDYRRQ